MNEKLLSLKKIKGLGKEKIEVLKKAINCNNMLDLIYYFPRKYIDRTLISDEKNLNIGEEVTLIIKIVNTFMGHNKKVSRFICNCKTQNGLVLNLVWFRFANYYHRKILIGQHLIVSGRLDYFGSSLQIAHPEIEFIDNIENFNNEIKNVDYNNLNMGRIIPLYPLNDKFKKLKIEDNSLRKWIMQALNFLKENNLIHEIIEEDILLKYNFMNRMSALYNIHFPKNFEILKEAQTRIKYEELYLFQIMMFQNSNKYKLLKRIYKPLEYNTSTLYKKLLNKIPFKLTNEQVKTIEKILKNSTNDYPISHLLQGDVGSGKTIVALAISLHYLEKGLQVALVAPTEVLARQHFIKISEFLSFEILSEIELLVGSDSKIEKLNKIARLQNGETKLIIGTHSLFEKDIIFKNLAFIIIDEQQRFGVKQRESLLLKAKNPDTLSMSATPIPRSLCLTEFSNLELILLKEKPIGRKEIKTMWLKGSNRKGLYKSIKKYINMGQQCYIVYPLIEESEKSDLQAAELAYQKLKDEIFPEFSIRLLHGRLKDIDKKSIMNLFRNGQIQILVCTSIIEVGVDVPNATMMVIENAERFGISQLHQMRGRVGRSELQSYCILVSDAKGEDTKERLGALVHSQDGFYLAEMDLKIRGTGEILGLRQHGTGEFKLANLIWDKDLCENAYQDVRKKYYEEKKEISNLILNEIKINFPEKNSYIEN